MIDRVKMEKQLTGEEGLRLWPYLDTAEPPNETIGIGYNITARGMDFFNRVIGRTVVLTAVGSKVACITADEARLVLDADMDRVEKAVTVACPWYSGLDTVRQRVCVDLAFNIGYSALQFKKTIVAIQARDWSAACRELLASRWRVQVGPTRSNLLAQMLLTGIDPIS